MALRVGPVGPSREAGVGCLGGQDWARSAALPAGAADRVRTSPAGGPSAERARLQSMRASTQAPRSRPRRSRLRRWWCRCVVPRSRRGVCGGSSSPRGALLLGWLSRARAVSWSSAPAGDGARSRRGVGRGGARQRRWPSLPLPLQARRLSRRPPSRRRRLGRGGEPPWAGDRRRAPDTTPAGTLATSSELARTRGIRLFN